MRLLLRVLLALCFIVGSALSSRASCSVTGRVINDLGNPVAQQAVHLSSASNGSKSAQSFYGLTDSLGVYSFSNVPCTKYDVEIVSNESLEKTIDLSKLTGQVTVPDLVYPTGVQLIATARTTGKHFTSGHEEYVFQLGLHVNADETQQISEVTYDLVYAPNPLTLSSRTPPTFAVSYVGWGCYGHVIVKVRRRSGEHAYAFNMCSVLNW
jgi:Carboxypeptidase regulatory-like domain